MAGNGVGSRERERLRGATASLREDYLNQVQRDFLSRALHASVRPNTPSEDARRPRADDGAGVIMAAWAAGSAFSRGPRGADASSDPQQAVQARAAGRVFERAVAARAQMAGDARGGERRLVEAAQHEPLLAGIVHDVADREQPRHAGLEARRVDRDLAPLERELLDVVPSTVTRTVERLERGGWVARTSGPEDRREVTVALTDAGRALVLGVMEDRASRIDRVLAAMAPGERTELARVLQRFSDTAGEPPGSTS